ncbi:MAG: response regulator, partial [Bacteroidota bacterium]
MKDVEIVIVDDNEDDAELTRRAMKSANFVNEITWLKDGEEAVHYLKGKGKYENRNINTKPRLILLDLKLPKLSGMQVLEQIKMDENL